MRKTVLATLVPMALAAAYGPAAMAQEAAVAPAGLFRMFTPLLQAAAER